MTACTAATSSSTLTPVRYHGVEARRLVRALYGEQLDLYGFADDPDDTPGDHFDPPRGLFVVARLDGMAVACGGIRLLDRRTAEVKRMYVSRSHRGAGIGRRVLRGLTARPDRRRDTDAAGDRRPRYRRVAALSTLRPCAARPYVDGRDPRVNPASTRILDGVGSPPSPTRTADPRPHDR
ncbi:GNAT family N-acetyltransferase [Actinoalloteichus hoggarensis]|uniref:GNAT family N-acetyltransferase n=1 Tax=Actinoalloteichus hoggarensis TaxID=1470176 RepID=UPI001B80302F